MPKDPNVFAERKHYSARFVALNSSLRPVIALTLMGLPTACAAENGAVVNDGKVTRQESTESPRVGPQPYSPIGFSKLEVMVLGDKKEDAIRIADEANFLIDRLEDQDVEGAKEKDLAHILTLAQEACELKVQSYGDDLGTAILLYYFGFKSETLTDGQLLEILPPSKQTEACFDDVFARHFSQKPEFLFSNKLGYFDTENRLARAMARYWKARGNMRNSSAYEVRAALGNVSNIDCTGMKITCSVDLWYECKVKLAGGDICRIDDIPMRRD